MKEGTFVSRISFTDTIDHKESSSFFIRAQDWVVLYSKHGFPVDDVMDISSMIRISRMAMQKTEASKASLVSYDRLGRMPFKRLSSYVLLSANRDSRFDTSLPADRWIDEGNGSIWMDGRQHREHREGAEAVPPGPRPRDAPGDHHEPDRAPLRRCADRCVGWQIRTCTKKRPFAPPSPVGKQMTD